MQRGCWPARRKSCVLSITHRKQGVRDYRDLWARISTLPLRLIPVKAMPEELPTLVFVNQFGRFLMDIINDDVSGKLMVTAFCLLVFGVFLAVVVTNLT